MNRLLIYFVFSSFISLGCSKSNNECSEIYRENILLHDQIKKLTQESDSAGKSYLLINKAKYYISINEFEIARKLTIESIYNSPDSIYYNKASKLLLWINKKIDENEFITAKNNNNIELMHKYLDKYPDGEFASEARSAIVDISIERSFRDKSSIWYSDFKEDDEMHDPYGYDNEEDFTTIQFCNHFDYAITVYLKGDENYTTIINPMKQDEIKIIPGEYKILMKGSNNQKYISIASFNRGIYSAILKSNAQVIDYSYLYNKANNTNQFYQNNTTIHKYSPYNSDMRINSTGNRIGAICRDGWRSHSTGRGTCSHHGGVAYWLYD